LLVGVLILFSFGYYMRSKDEGVLMFSFGYYIYMGSKGEGQGEDAIRMEGKVGCRKEG
jgi:hypothetical protein